MNFRAEPASAELWCRRNLTVTVRSADGQETVTQVDKPYARVGSKTGCEVLLPKTESPRRGLYLHATDEGIFCLSLVEPQANITVGGGWLAPSQHVKLGSLRISCRFTEGPDARTDLPDLRDKWIDHEDHDYLHIDTSEGPIQHPLRRPLTLIGNRKPSKLRLEHSSLSGCHCVIFVDQSRCWVVDLLSAHGTKLEGQRVEAAELRAGGLLHIGHVQITHTTPARAATEDDSETEPKARYFSSREITGDNALGRLLRHLQNVAENDADDASDDESDND